MDCDWDNYKDRHSDRAVWDESYLRENIYNSPMEMAKHLL